MAASRALLATASFLSSQPCDDITPVGASGLTGYALHIMELDVGSRERGRQGHPFDSREIYCDPVGAQQHDTVRLFHDVVCHLSRVFQHYGHGQALSMTYLTPTPGSGFVLHVATIEERPPRCPSTLCKHDETCLLQ